MLNQIELYGLRITTYSSGVTTVRTKYMKGSKTRPTEVHIKTELINKWGLLTCLNSGAKHRGNRATKCKILLGIINEHLAA